MAYTAPSEQRRKRRAVSAALLLLLPVLLVLSSCRREAPSSDPQAGDDNPRRGEITIAADESFQPIVSSSIDVYHSSYPETQINALWMPENQAIQQLLEGKVRLVVVSRELTPEERAVFEQQTIVPHTVKIAEDGVALIVNRSNPDSMITMDQLRKVFSGEARQWSGLGGSGSAEDIVIVFDQSNSSNLNFILRTFDRENLEGLNVFAAESNAQVVEYVQNHPNAMGVIGAGWISDADDPGQQEFLSSIRVMAVADTTNPSVDDYYQPYQAYIALKEYPLRRSVYIISREARAGLGGGFTTLVAGERGQRIILKSGLLPATMPMRLVRTKDSEYDLQ